jgi:flagellin
MALVPNTNISSLIAQRRLSINTDNLHKSMERLASGYRINRSADDAAGLSVSQNLVSQIRRMQQASRNTQDGISALEITEGSLEVIGDNLQRVRELAVTAGNDTNGPSERAAINTEIQSLLGDVDRIAQASNFNGINLLDGTATNAVIQVGPNSSAAINTVDITPVLTSATSTGLAIVGGGGQTFAAVGAINLSTSTIARSFLTDVDTALTNLNAQRSKIGSMQNKLDSVTQNLEQGIESFSASNSRIRDVDIASETSNMVQSQILTQAATTVLTQTNDLPHMILSLLQNR